MFSEKIDSTIQGFSLVLAFIIFGIMLQFDVDFFGNATKFFQILFVVLGVIGLFTEIRKLNFYNNIKGLDNIIYGIITVLVFIFLRNNINTVNWLKIIIPLYEFILFIMILVGIYGACEGIIQMIFSIYTNYTKKENGRKIVFTNILMVLGQLLGLALMVAQIYEIFK